METELKVYRFKNLMPAEGERFNYQLKQGPYILQSIFTDRECMYAFITGPVDFKLLDPSEIDTDRLDTIEAIKIIKL